MKECVKGAMYDGVVDDVAMLVVWDGGLDGVLARPPGGGMSDEVAVVGGSC